MEVKKITVLGCGRWATFLTWYCSKVGYKTTIWGRESSIKMAKLIKDRANEYVNFQKEVMLTTNVEEAIDGAQIIIISISSQQLRSLIKNIDKKLFENKIIVLCMKGIESCTGKRLSQIAIEEGISEKSIAVWLGPGHIQEFVKGVPNCMTIDSLDKNLTKELTDVFDSKLIRFYYGEDLIGNEIGAAMKNVIGIAAGMLDGLGYSTLKGPLMSRGVREVGRLIKACGGNERTAYGLTHLGDYETTLFSIHSNNRKYGEEFIKGIKSEKLAEGVETTKAAIMLAEKYGVDMPITKCVYEILFNNANPDSQLATLFNRSKKEEF